MEVTIDNLTFFYNCYIYRNCNKVDFTTVNEFINIVREKRVTYKDRLLTTRIKKLK